MLSDLILWPIAAVMTYVTARILKWSARVKDNLHYALSVFLLAMMGSMFGGVAIFFLMPPPWGLTAAVVVPTIVMVVAFVPVLGQLVKMSFEHNQEAPPQDWGVLSERIYARLFIVALALLSELLMGYAFTLASNPSLAHEGLLASLVRSVSTYWFVFPMSTEMGLTLYYFRREFKRPVIPIFAAQSVIMFLTPTALASSRWTEVTVYMGGALMTGLFIYFFDLLYKHRSINRVLGDYIFQLMAVYGGMMAGLFLYMGWGRLTLLDASILTEMVVYFNVILAPKRMSAAPEKSWMLDALWSFRFLLATFVSEFFMAGVIDLEYYGTRQFLSSVSFASLSGSFPNMVGASLFNFLSAFSLITGSGWYYLMMGTEMGALVVFRMFEVKTLETRIRMALMLAAYFVYSTFLPYFVIPGKLQPHLPFIGWTMGIGTVGPVAPAFFVGLWGTYLVYGVLSFLFGSRALCSVLCTAATMYQGTLYDSMKTFNRTSKIGRKLLGSRITPIFKRVSTMVWVSLIAASTASYLNSVGVVHITVYGTDAAEFLYSFYFNFLWYIVFMLIPFIGTYGCVTTGMCHWGMTNQWISRLGFFRLKVKDRNTCRKCPTKDCSKACPVGNTDMPGQFIAKGEFRSYKCIGVGDCVESCPYGNIYFYDVRNWLREKLGVSPVRPKASVPLRVNGKRGTQTND